MNEHILLVKFGSLENYLHIKLTLVKKIGTLVSCTLIKFFKGKSEVTSTKGEERQIQCQPFYVIRKISYTCSLYFD